MDKGVKYQVFVSSTYEDLKDERKEVTQAILEAHCIPAGMELFPASNKTQWEVIKKVIDDSDFYLLIIAGRYGSIGQDEFGNKVGYTEMEFDYAVKTQKPILTLVHDNIDSLPKNKTESSMAKEAKLKKFRDKASKERMRKTWNNKDNLKAAVLAALTELKSSTDAVGWIRSDFKVEQQSYAFLEQQRSEYEAQISSLQKKLGNLQRTISEKDREIEKSKICNYNLDVEIKKLMRRWNDLTKVQEDYDNFWVQLLQINVSYEYFMEEHGDLWEDIRKERSLSDAEGFFFSCHGDSALWRAITGKTKQLLDEYSKMSSSERENYLKNIEVVYEKYAGYRDNFDAYIISDDELTEVVGLTFFLIQICGIDRKSDLHSLLCLNKEKFISVCDMLIEEAWETELALRENDY